MKVLMPYLYLVPGLMAAGCHMLGAGEKAIFPLVDINGIR